MLYAASYSFGDAVCQLCRLGINSDCMCLYHLFQSENEYILAILSTFKLERALNILFNYILNVLCDGNLDVNGVSF